MLHIKVVGTGCPNCQNLEKMCQEVITENNLDGEVEKVTDISKFAELGIFMTPGLVVNGKVLSSGKIPLKSTLEHWLKDTIEGK
jgi:small redox-active disulfide protein 2